MEATLGHERRLQKGGKLAGRGKGDGPKVIGFDRSGEQI
jgi:hypothetical protein